MNDKRSVETRWTPKLAKKFCMISSFFLANHHRLPAHGPGTRSLNSTEVLILIHIVDYKWDARAPFPAVKTLAKRMGITDRAVRAALQTLENAGYLQRERTAGGPNRYHLQGLFDALEKLMNTTEEAA